jgi:hypothetical protein
MLNVSQQWVPVEYRIKRKDPVSLLSIEFEYLDGVFSN